MWKIIMYFFNYLYFLFIDSKYWKIYPLFKSFLLRKKCKFIAKNKWSIILFKLICFFYPKEGIRWTISLSFTLIVLKLFDRSDFHWWKKDEEIIVTKYPSSINLSASSIHLIGQYWPSSICKGSPVWNIQICIYIILNFNQLGFISKINF